MVYIMLLQLNWEQVESAKFAHFDKYALFYKQHFHKQRQAKTGKKLSKS